MENIVVTFPVHIPKNTIKFIIEENLKKNSKYECEVVFAEFEDKENVFIISSDSAEAFYLIGIISAGILEKFTPEYCSLSNHNS